MRKTKIICTLGPACTSVELLTQLINAGLDVARLNFSHGTHEEHAGRIELLKKACEITGKNVALLQDTKGIKIRTGYVNGYTDADKLASIELKKGETITYICDNKQAGMGGEPSTAERMFIDYDDLASQTKPGMHIYLDDGIIETKITAVHGNTITAKIMNGGRITSRRAVNIPEAKLQLESLTPQDQRDILFGIKQGVDFVALSFVRRLDDVVKARKFLDDNGGKRIMLIAKIENQEGVENLDEILMLSDGVMVARGDMAVEIPFYKVPAIQKQMIAKALTKGKIVITATQMLHSMIKDPTPTRAEVSDIFNAVEDSTTCIMLSGETANGQYPVESVKVMSAIAETAEDTVDYEAMHSKNGKGHGHVTTSICRAAVHLASQVNAKAIVAYSESGLTAKRLGALRTSVPMLLVSNNMHVVRQCHMMWGLHPIYNDPVSSVEDLYTTAMQLAEKHTTLEDGDNIVVVAGTLVGVAGSTNGLRVMTKGDVALRGTSMSTVKVRGQIKICKDAQEAKEKLKKGDIAVVYRLYPDFEPYLQVVSGVLLVSMEYDEHMLAKAQAKGIAVIIDVHGVEARVKDGALVDVVGGKGVVLRV